MAPDEPSFTRLNVDERRSRLLELGQRLFAEHSYEKLSMSRIAREAGVSKALLYHYFPSKQELFVATIAEGGEDLVASVAADPSLAPGEALLKSLRAYVDWVDARRASFAKLLRNVTVVPEVAEIVGQVRTQTGARILDGLTEASGKTPPPAARTAVAGWLGFMDAAILDWIEHEDVGRDELVGLLIGTLLGALTAAGAGELLEALA